MTKLEVFCRATELGNDNSFDFEDFESLKKAVTPIEQDKVPTKKQLSDEVASVYRRKAAERRPLKHENFLTEMEVEPVSPDDVLSYKVSGIQPGVFKKLRLGHYGFDYKLDLHRKTVSEAREEVFNLLKYADLNGFRCVLITHGKGRLSNPPARIKSYVNHWLKQVDLVLAFHSAIPKHGGVGATYVLLKKPSAPNRINEVKFQ